MTLSLRGYVCELFEAFFFFTLALTCLWSQVNFVSPGRCLSAVVCLCARCVCLPFQPSELLSCVFLMTALWDSLIQNRDSGEKIEL